MGEVLKFLLYFLIGGSIVTLVTYFGSRMKGLTAAFLAMFPFLTTLTLITIYYKAWTTAIIP
jgi:hypothetical protein